MTHITPSLPNWSPPPDFQPVESAVDGILVFAPRPESPAVAAPVTYKCPNCGATTHYDVAAGGVACEYCGFTATVEAEQVGLRAVEHEFTLETVNQAEQGWGVERLEMHCESCGANLLVEHGALAVTCAFCASNRVNVHPAPTEVLRPRFLIPFKLKAADVRTRAKEWLGRGWYHPAELSQTAVVDKFRGIYLPFWTFDARISANWRAEVGYERQERYYDHGDKEWKTRTYIDWRWENGHVEVMFDDLTVTGSARLSRRILDRLYPFNLNDLVAYSPDFLAGWQAQAYEVNLNDAWEDGRRQMREQAKEACYADIPTHHVRNFGMTADFADEEWRYVLLPVYLAVYRFQDHIYQVMVNGQTGTVAGQKPVAWWKIWLVIGLLFSPGLCLGLVSLPLMLAGGVGVFTIILALILLVVAGAVSFWLYRQAVESEAA